jgi:hypothetical protein
MGFMGFDGDTLMFVNAIIYKPPICIHLSVNGWNPSHVTIGLINRPSRKPSREGFINAMATLGNSAEFGNE